MDKALTDRIERQVRQAFPDGVIARVQVLQYGDDPEVEPGQAAMRVFFEPAGSSPSEGSDKAPETGALSTRPTCSEPNVARGCRKAQRSAPLPLPTALGRAKLHKRLHTQGEDQGVRRVRPPDQKRMLRVVIE